MARQTDRAELSIRELELKKRSLKAQLRDLRQRFPGLPEKLGIIDQYSPGPRQKLARLTHEIEQVDLQLNDRTEAYQIRRKAKPSAQALETRSNILDKHTPDRMKRLTIIRQSLKDCPHMKTVDLCKRLDFQNHAPPLEWREKDDVTTWSDAYKKPRLRQAIQTMLSKDKREINGLTDLP